MYKKKYNFYIFFKVEEDKDIKKVMKLFNSNPNQILNIAVSFDSTWLSRRFSVLYGIGAVIETITDFYHFIVQ